MANKVIQNDLFIIKVAIFKLLRVSTFLSSETLDELKIGGNQDNAFVFALVGRSDDSQAEHLAPDAT